MNDFDKIIFYFTELEIKLVIILKRNEIVYACNALANLMSTNLMSKPYSCLGFSLVK